MTDVIAAAEKAIRSGDRVEWRRLLSVATDQELTTMWVRGAVSRVQDFGNLAFNELQNRKSK